MNNVSIIGGCFHVLPFVLSLAYFLDIIPCQAQEVENPETAPEEETPQPTTPHPKNPEETEKDAEDENEGFGHIKSTYGSIRIGALLQPGFEILPNHIEGKRNGFALYRTRLRLDGHFISENVTYLLSGDALNGFERATRDSGPGSETRPLSGGPSVPFLLDALISWRIPKIGVTFTFGRFVPKWGLIMPESVSHLGAISYPLYVHGGQNSLGIFRTLGLEAELEVNKYLRLGGGVFNGGKNTWLDENDRKDFVAHVDVTPMTGLIIRASSLFSFPDVSGGIRDDGTPLTTGYETHIAPVVEARYRDYGLDIMAGFAASIVLRDEADMRGDYQAYGFLGHVGYVLIGDWFQLMARGEFWEPDNETPNNAQVRITVGPQVLIEKLNAQLSFNFIHDIFSSAEAMCETYLGLDTCGPFDIPPEAQEKASTIIVEFTLNL